MTSTSESKSNFSFAAFVNGLVARLPQARFFTVSLLLHLVIVIVAGSAVLYKVTAEAPDFTAGDGSLVASDSMEAAPPQEEVQTPDPTFTPATPTASAPSISAITSSATQAQFSMNAVPTVSKGISNDGAAALAGMSKRAGEGMGAAMGKMGGTRTAMIFGKKVEATKLGVILDVSGSAHPHLAIAIEEINKGFSDALLVLYPGCGMGSISEKKSAHEIRKFSSIKKEEIPDKVTERNTAQQLSNGFHRVPEFEKMVKRPVFKDRLYVSWFEGPENKGGGTLTSQTQVAFDFVLKQNVDTIYWFADFADQVNGDITKELLKELKRKHVKVYLHNFAGKPIGPEASMLAEGTGGTINIEKPK